MLVPSPQHDGKYGLFLQCFRWRALWLRRFAGYPFGASRIKHQPFPEARPSKEMPEHTLAKSLFCGKAGEKGRIFIGYGNAAAAFHDGAQKERVRITTNP